MIKFRLAKLSDSELFFNWANDYLVRQNSYNSNLISWDEHDKWYSSKILDEKCHIYLFYMTETEFVGQVRIQEETNQNATIGISIDERFRGQGLGKKLIRIASKNFLASNSGCTINAYIKLENIASKDVFIKAGFVLKEIVDFNSIESYHFIKYAN